MDTTRRPVRVGDWTAVLSAIYDADPNDEQSWLEWKSEVDLRSKEQIGTIVAKAIIAFANRDPDRAALYVGGVGILAIGIEPGSVQGVSPVDNADLDKLVSSYVGSDGPVWIPHWTQFNGKAVLIIEVASPQWGDPPHAFRKDIERISDGTVYVRKLARSVPADHREVLRLAERFAARSNSDNDLRVSLEVECPTPLSRYSWEEADVERVVASQTARLLEPVEEEQSEKRAAAGGLASEISFGSSIFSRRVPENRSQAEYLKEIEEYAQGMRSRFPAATAATAHKFIPAPVFKLRNLSTKNYHKVLVKVSMPDYVDARPVKPRLGMRDFLDVLPALPRKWGPRESTLSSPDIFKGLPFVSPLVTPPPIARIPTTTVEPGDEGPVVVFAPVDLRPGEVRVLEDKWAILVASNSPNRLIARWAATATNSDGPPATGEVELRFEGPDMNIFRMMAADTRRMAAGE